MELREFVAETLTQLCGAVVDAQKATESMGAVVSPRIIGTEKNGFRAASDEESNWGVLKVHFDIALSVTENKKSKTGGNAKFSLSVGNTTLSLGGGAEEKTQKDNSDSTKVNFDIPIIIPSLSVKEAVKILEKRPLPEMPQYYPRHRIR